MLDEKAWLADFALIHSKSSNCFAIQVFNTLFIRVPAMIHRSRESISTQLF